MSEPLALRHGPPIEVLNPWTPIIDRHPVADTTSWFLFADPHHKPPCGRRYRRRPPLSRNLPHPYPNETTGAWLARTLGETIEDLREELQDDGWIGWTS